MAINFPLSPTLNETYSSGEYTWKWNGSAWDVVATDPRILLINSQTGTSYTLVLSDSGKLIEMNNASANTVTVPPNSSVAFSTGTQINLLQVGSGQTTIVAGSGVTINATPGLILSEQWAAATLIKRATDTWVLVGNLIA